MIDGGSLFVSVLSGLLLALLVAAHRYARLRPVVMVVLLTGGLLGLMFAYQPAPATSTQPPAGAAAAAAAPVDNPTPFPTRTPLPTQPPTTLFTPAPSTTPPPTSRPGLTNPRPTPTPPPPHLAIPALTVADAVVTVPIVNGEWDITTLDDQLGWLTTTGDSPTADLAMVFVAHLTRPGDTPTAPPRPGPFAHLDRLRLGDQVIYTLNDTDYIYEISQVGRVDPANVRALYQRTPGTLLLLTCTDWDATDAAYRSRLLITATLIQTRPTGQRQ